MKWVKKGHIFMPDGKINNMSSHAQGPTVLETGETLKIYFSSRTTNNKSLPFFLEYNLLENKITSLSKVPILDFGMSGTFDEHGIIPDEIIRINNKIYLYYIGWSKRTTTPYSLSIGLAISEDNGNTFYKHSKGPILGIEKGDQFSVTAPGVFFENGLFYMYYTSGLAWHKINDRYEHTYTIRCAISNDGINWNRDYINTIEPKNDFECISNPSILKINKIYHMWFCYKGSNDFRGKGKNGYRIGYAYSQDLINWIRNDKLAGIEISNSGWDSEMIEYPHVREINNDYYMFYNGNGFGKSGFGYAKLIK